ncbi:MAG TPA: hypothetical protein VL966_19990 [Alphaproteobacteria bacterium]|nr:hypothetical protein [Alphaproteobacteria bacterium]
MSRALGALALLQAVVLIGCSGQAIVPPVDISSTSGAKAIPGHYAATVQTGSWLLKTTTDRSICGAWTFDTDLNTSYESAIRNALQRVLERVTFIPDLLTPQQLKARGFDAQIVIGQGGANSTFAVPVYAVSGTAQGNIELSVTVSIRPAAGNATQETVSARGHGRAEITHCSGAATAISASARNALGTVARGIVRSVQQRLDIREANSGAPPQTKIQAAERPKAVARDERDDAAPETPPEKEDAAPMPQPEADVPVASNALPVQPPKAADRPAAQSLDRRETHEMEVAVVPRPPANARSRDVGPLSPEQAFQRGVDAVDGHNTRKSDEEAVRWFRIAADQGYAPAENNLGYMYAEGRGVTRDDETAVKWYRRAANRGYPPAQTSLAMMLQEGRGAPQNDVQALALYSAAAGQGYAPATANVAQMVAQGRGIPRDEDTAAFLMATAGEAPRTGSGIFVDGE